MYWLVYYDGANTLKRKSLHVNKTKLLRGSSARHSNFDPFYKKIMNSSSSLTKQCYVCGSTWIGKTFKTINTDDVTHFNTVLKSHTSIQEKIICSDCYNILSSRYNFLTSHLCVREFIDFICTNSIYSLY